MGRYSYSSRSTTNECNSISMKFLKKHCYLNGGIRCGGISWSWCGEKHGSIGFTVSTIGGDEYIRFQYTHTSNYTGEKTELDYKVSLVATHCHFRGRRWWFICPLVVNGVPCNRRVGVLYFGGGRHLGCRHCYNLTYNSCKESHSLDRIWREMGISPKVGNMMFRKTRS